MMNKKILICGAIALGLFLAACSKKDDANQSGEQQAQSETNASVASEQFHPLDASETQEQPSAPVAQPVQPAPKVEIHREETEHTTTEIRRRPKTEEPAETENTESSSRNTETDDSNTSASHVTPKKESKAKDSTANESTKNSSGKLTEDDAVAAAIAAATPALKE
ncbi:MAG: hypothetical protein QM666_03840 [Acinetobacter sp.]